MNERDLELGAEINELQPLEHGPDFFQKLETALQDDQHSGTKRARKRAVLVSALSGIAAAVIIAVFATTAPKPSPPRTIEAARPESTTTTVPAITTELQPQLIASTVAEKTQLTLLNATGLRGVVTTASKTATMPETKNHVSFRLRANGDFWTSNDFGTSTYVASEGTALNCSNRRCAYNSDLTALDFTAHPSTALNFLSGVQAVTSTHDNSLLKTEVSGREAWQLTSKVRSPIDATGTVHNRTLTVDAETYLPLRLVDTGSDKSVSTYTLSEYELNPSFGNDAFSLDVPSGTVEVTGERRSVRRTTLAAAQSTIGYAPRLPSYVPDGFKIAEVTAFDQPDNYQLRHVLIVTYRRGFQALTVTNQTYETELDLNPPLVSGANDYSSTTKLQVKKGILKGREAEVTVSENGNFIVGRTSDFAVSTSGDLDTEALEAVICSIPG